MRSRDSDSKSRSCEHACSGRPGSSPTSCPQCQGRGQQRFQQGFFTVARTCGRCHGTGRIITKPCATCKGEGRTSHERKLTVKIPAGIADGQRLRISGEGEGGTEADHPQTCTLHPFAEHTFFPRDGNNLSCAVP